MKNVRPRTFGNALVGVFHDVSMYFSEQETLTLKNFLSELDEKENQPPAPAPAPTEKQPAPAP